MPFKNPADKVAWRAKNSDRNRAYFLAWHARRLEIDPEYRERERQKEERRQERQAAKLAREKPPLLPRQCRQCNTMFIPKTRLYLTCRECLQKPKEQLLPRECVVCRCTFIPIRANQLVHDAACRRRRMRQQARESDRKRYSENEEYRRAQIKKSQIKFKTDEAYRKRWQDWRQKRRAEERERQRPERERKKAERREKAKEKRRLYNWTRFHCDPVWRKKRQEYQRRRWLDPEIRKRMEEAIESWRKRKLAEDPDYANRNCRKFKKKKAERDALVDLLKTIAILQEKLSHANPRPSLCPDRC